MSKYASTGYLRSFKNAFNGLSCAYKSQKNYRFHLLIGFISLLLGILLNFKCLEYCVLILAISNVITAELFNSVIEFTLDAYYKNKYSKLVKWQKTCQPWRCFYCRDDKSYNRFYTFCQKNSDTGSLLI